MKEFDFKTDLKVGQQGEKIVAKFLERKYNAKGVSFNNSKTLDKLKGHDLSFVSEKGVQVLAEVKTDLQAAQTGNVAIEVECSNRPSGVMNSGSDIFVYLIPQFNKLMMASTKDLKALVEDRESQPAGQNAFCVLLSIEELDSICWSFGVNCGSVNEMI